jgi:rare lipoprotein A (peptidoglycan hydrolase)
MKYYRFALSALLLGCLVVPAWIAPVWAGPACADLALLGGQEPAEKQSDESERAPRTSKEAGEPERGYAAFYSASLEGHKTACGRVYSASKLTAAHRNLPCGTRLRVTNLRNGKTVRVTVTDHGPFSNGRILDLSYEAARHLGFLTQGTTLVKVEVLR